MGEKGYRPEGDCSCCHTCGLFCEDGQIPCLGVSFGASVSTHTPPGSPACPGSGWDCNDDDDPPACAPEGSTVEMEGQQGSRVSNLPAWALYELYTPAPDTYYCVWSTSPTLITPLCRCPNEGECTTSYNCDACTCFWEDLGCPPGTTCSEQLTCSCSAFITHCDHECFEDSCPSTTHDCEGNCCDLLDPNNCGLSAGNVCAGIIPYSTHLLDCTWHCNEFDDGGCLFLGSQGLTVIIYRTDANHVIMATRLIWGACFFDNIEDLGEGPIDCCNINVDLGHSDPGNCCCAVPTVTIFDCCGD
jgi:hypothetical protein